MNTSKSDTVLAVLCFVIAVIGLIILLQSVYLGVRMTASDLRMTASDLIRGMDVSEITLRREHYTAAFRLIGGIL
ncbi:hypothetical protein [Cohnella lupini]|uniref:hypothetical protein n=1 Tax=Cohnella lupini TaxID=1294267 RepID=UPI0011C05E12|nr:hypothetical protein [Cohnella lupini]